ncbi:aryl-alcohol dehydrogenase-like predicted oxidoreductase [Saccharothrix carnea]|uniref:Aryl-alcohol dehydrogenase-like predicted oxidoreductase n=1 Tax=Saccharothrix carnea TaxID=1280637 RepID=A0A2P8IG41_SACCR|nr:aldo/keto reductase [Saccharothrix carnea]PSL57438.1 aryl-alcohol dehydrogenase-like predicted oxidoreductase [Saccharothrix carnea]
MTIPQRRIGRDGPSVGVLALGSWHTYDRMPFHDAVAMVRRAVDAGVTLFDVGYYGGFGIDGKPVPESYTDVLFGRIAQAAGVRRDSYQLSAKLWVNHFPAQSMGEQLDRLLFRVGTDRADYAILGDLFGLEPDLGLLTAQLGELVAAGRLGGWGVNNWSVDHIRAAHAAAVAQGVPGPTMAQLKYSVVRRSIPDGAPFRGLVEELGLTIQASDVLEGGMLAGNLTPDRVIGKDPGGIRAGISDAARELAAVAAGFDATPAQVAIAFCLADPTVTTVLFGASRVAQLEENLAAVRLAEERGLELRKAVDGLWLDRDLVDPTGR